MCPSSSIRNPEPHDGMPLISSEPIRRTPAISISTTAGLTLSNTSDTTPSSNNVSCPSPNSDANISPSPNPNATAAPTMASHPIRPTGFSRGATCRPCGALPSTGSYGIGSNGGASVASMSDNGSLSCARSVDGFSACGFDSLSGCVSIAPPLIKLYTPKQRG